MITCDYTGLADHYEQWSMGDAAYMPVAHFYLSYLADYCGVFAELGVGTGRVALPLSLRPNVLVYGIDVCEMMLERCRQQMIPNSNLELICTDFAHFKLPQRADIIYMPFRTIGHILTKRELETFFYNVCMNLKQNGLFIFDHYIFSKAWAVRHNNVELPMYESDDLRIVDRYVYDFENNLMHCEVKCNEKITAQFDFRWIDVGEIEDIYPRYGFSCTALYGNFDKSIWMPESPNQIWILRRVD
jgi:SAM-dependent methyltransferase